jgi:hypothetical protein
MPALIWTGTAFAVLAVMGLVALALTARRFIRAAESPEAARRTVNTLAALNGAALGMGLLGAGLVVIGTVL